jgi:hypothetical protein
MTWQIKDSRDLLVAVAGALVVYAASVFLELVSSFVSALVAIVAASVIILVLRASRANPPAKIELEARPPKSGEKRTYTIFQGSLEVHKRREQRNESLLKGDVIEGVLEEIDGLPFDFYIFDERNYAKFSNDRTTGTPALELVDESSYHIKWTVGHQGVWYFVFDLYGKQHDRTIRGTLRRYTTD